MKFALYFQYLSATCPVERGALLDQLFAAAHAAKSPIPEFFASCAYSAIPFNHPAHF